MTLSKKFDAARERWLATRKQVGLQIDPEIAEVTWIYTQTLDPYGVYPELRKSISKSAANTSRATLEVKCGCYSGIYRTPPAKLCGKGIGRI
jgi:hypothetical protein